MDKVIRKDLKVVGLTVDIAQDRRLWQERNKVSDHKEIASYMSFGYSRLGLYSGSIFSNFKLLY